MAKISIIGSGFSGISAAAYLAAEGHEVHVFEKNAQLGGRARQLKTVNGYTFDMGPSWYWMPGVFERFFKDFGYEVSDFYKLTLLSPSFDIVFGQKEIMHIPENYGELCSLFESIEEGSSAKLDRFMAEAEYKYKTGIDNLVYKPGLSLGEFVDMDLLKGVFRLQVFSSFSTHVRKYFKNPKLIALMEFPVLFLGAMPQDTPALYSLMNYAGLKLGTWYPQGGFKTVIDAMVEVATNKGAIFHTSAEIEKIEVNQNKATHLLINGEEFKSDIVIAGADYHHVESKLLESQYRNYTESYWQKKTFAPSCLIFYLGINKRLSNINHHTLFFDEDLDEHSVDIYRKPQWPAKPLFYVCCPSQTDSSVAPHGHENLFLLMPIAPGLEDTDELREEYFKIMMNRLEGQLGESITEFIDYKQSYCIKDFIDDYNSFKGNAYGLANTLRQTALLKPSIKNKKVNNLFYTGQLTVPGPGVPPSIISGKVVSDQVLIQLNKSKHEITV